MNRIKHETGAELLARLHKKPDLKCIDPFVFGDTSLSSSSYSSSSSSSGKIIEIFGPEGVGKTELALHCAAKACLPVGHNKCELRGLGSKVIIIDTDFKFSILRLAVILEKQVKHAMLTSKAKLGSNEGEEKVVLCDSCSEHNKERVFPKTNDNSELITKGNSKEVSLSLSFGTRLNQMVCSPNVSNDVKKGCKCMADDETSLKSKETARINTKPSPSSNLGLQNSDIEDIIKESLENVVILKVKSSQQLLASLLSLETTLAEDPTFALLVIDSISSFYLVDRVTELKNNTTRKMIPVSQAISRLVEKFRVTCLAISSAFFASGKLYSNNSSYTSRRSGGNLSAREFGKNSWITSEFLGKSWISVRSKRIVLFTSGLTEDGEYSAKAEEKANPNTATVGIGNGKTIDAFCSLTNKRKRYVFCDDFMVESS